MLKEEVTLRVNSRAYEVEVEPYTTLADCLRDHLGFNGVKVSCNDGDCGACTVLFDDKAFDSCITLAVESEGVEITTIEGLANGETLHPIQKAFIENHGLQCGFCTPGAILSAKALLDKNLKPTEQEVRIALSGNLCRCGSYPKIVNSIFAAASMMGGKAK